MTPASVTREVAGTFPLPWLPPGADPETWLIDDVSQLLRSAAYFPLFSVPDPAAPNRPLLASSRGCQGLFAVEVNEQLRHFDLGVPALRTRDVRGWNEIGAPIGRVQIRWTLMPDDFVAAPGREPPRTLLDPRVSQRFCMLDGRLTFRDSDSGFRAFGTGRTFPATEGGRPRLRVGAVVDALVGFGAFDGLQATITVNGYIEPPNGLALNLLLRVMDPDGRLCRTVGRRQAARTPAEQEAVFMAFLGEVDSSRPVTLIGSPDGRAVAGSRVHERLRLVHFAADAGRAPRGRTTEGPLAGTVDAQLAFNMFDPGRVIPITTRRGVFSFFDEDGDAVGTIRADMVEGRAFRTSVDRFPMPLFRFGGFGPILGGTGCFAGCDGLMTMNSAVSVFPRTLSNLYVFRFHDPDYRLHAPAPGA